MLLEGIGPALAEDHQVAVEAAAPSNGCALLAKQDCPGA
jgi:hypothetical protein